MRAAVGCFACLAGCIASIASAGSQLASRAIHLESFYEIDKTGTATLQLSDSAPWYILKDAAWGNSTVLKQGYVPVVHDSKPYYCLVKNVQKIGSRFPDKDFLCGDPAAVESVVGNNYQVTRILPDWQQGGGIWGTN